jgi:hypothetical protein
LDKKIATKKIFSFNMATYKDYQPTKHDDYFTNENTWIQLSKIINKYIDPNLVVSMPFYSPYSKCNELLGKHIKNKIIYQNEDFFKNNRGDIVIDNPPFNTKKDILEELYKRDKPFMLILPVSSMCYKYYRIFKDNQKDLSFLIFKGRPYYIKCNPTTGELSNEIKSPAFDSIVFCYKIKLDSQIVFLE